MLFEEIWSILSERPRLTRVGIVENLLFMSTSFVRVDDGPKTSGKADSKFVCISKFLEKIIVHNYLKDMK